MMFQILGVPILSESYMCTKKRKYSFNNWLKFCKDNIFMAVNKQKSTIITVIALNSLIIELQA